jgi:iron/zinc/copper transport system ATP-binding protein
MLEVHHLTVGYDSGPILTDFSVTFDKGQLIGIIGPNGAGKSTLIKSILGIIRPTDGDVRWDGALVTKKVLQQAFSYVPQRSELDLSFPINVFDLVMMGRLTRISRWHTVDATDEAVVTDALQALKIDDLARRSLNELSGGQRQRALVARALVQDAAVYLLDEPFVGIDVASENAIMAVLKTLRDAGKTIIIVHHDLNKVTTYFDKVLLMNHDLLAFGDPSQVLSSTALYHAYGDALIFVNDSSLGGAK